MNYYRTLSQQLEDIRSVIKHNPEAVDLYEVRTALFQAIQDLDVLAHLRRPDVYSLQRLEGSGDTAIVRVTIQMDLDSYAAEELVRKLWLELEYPPEVSDAQPAVTPIPAEPPVQQPEPPE